MGQPDLRNPRFLWIQSHSRLQKEFSMMYSMSLEGFGEIKIAARPLALKRAATCPLYDAGLMVEMPMVEHWEKGPGRRGHHDLSAPFPCE